MVLSLSGAPAQLVHTLALGHAAEQQRQVLSPALTPQSQSDGPHWNWCLLGAHEMFAEEMSDLSR